jgi:very-short-patch-repair endonuclease
VDFRFAGTNVVVEVLGYRYHRTKEQIGRDSERMNALTADGYRIYQFTYDMVTLNPGDVVDAVRDALRG